MMNFMLIESLEHVVLVNIASTFWNKHIVRASVIEFTNSDLFIQSVKNHRRRETVWQEIEDKVIEKVPQLSIAAVLKEKLLGYIKTVGLHILRFMEYHRCFCRSDLDLPNQFFWTAQGVIDKKKTIEILIKDENIDVKTRYKLACVYCFENDIRKLWYSIPENIKKSVLIEGSIGEDILTDFLIFWRMYLSGEVDKFSYMIIQSLHYKGSAYRYMFQCAASSGNKAATEYFLQKLFPEPVCLFTTALQVGEMHHSNCPRITEPPQEYHSEVLCYLLSQMNEEEQVNVFKKDAYYMFVCLLDWHVNTASHLWKFLPEKMFFLVLDKIIRKGIWRFKDYNYNKMFREVWQQAPESHKRYLLKYSISNLLQMLLNIADKESIKLVVQDATFEKRHEFIFSNTARHLCEEMIHEWDLVKFFIQLFISSKDEMIKLKKAYEEYILRRKVEQQGRDGLENDKFRFIILPNWGYKEKEAEFLKLLEDLIFGYEKRKNIDEDISNTAKRLCNIDFDDCDM